MGEIRAVFPQLPPLLAQPIQGITFHDRGCVFAQPAINGVFCSYQRRGDLPERVVKVEGNYFDS
jgi:hypothetical protein